MTLSDIKTIYVRLKYLLDRRRKLFLIILFFMSVLLSVVETAGISVIMPFVSVASNPEMVNSGWYKFFYELLGFSDTSKFVITFGIVGLIKSTGLIILVIRFVTMILSDSNIG